MVLQGIKVVGSNIQEGAQFFNKPSKRGLILHIEDQGFVGVQHQCPANVETLMLEFSAVFATPLGLPPI